MASALPSGVSKVFWALEEGGPTLLEFSLDIMRRIASVAEVVVVVREEDFSRAEELVGRSDWARVVIGGSTRQESVRCGLSAIRSDAELVLVHDGARAFCSLEEMNRVLAVAQASGAAILGVPVSSTLKRVSDRETVAETVSRKDLWEAQTPQVFRRALLLEAHEKAETEGFNGTDDSALVERLGHEVRMVEGARENMKLTTPADLQLARALHRLRAYAE